MTDDGIREVHGVRCREDGGGPVVQVRVFEVDTAIILARPDAQVMMTEWQARYLASKLYRLARRIRQRRIDAEDQPA